MQKRIKSLLNSAFCIHRVLWKICGKFFQSSEIFITDLISTIFHNVVGIRVEEMWINILNYCNQKA